MKRKNIIQHKPNPVLYFFAGIYFCIASRLKFKLKITGTRPKGPALILSNHTSNYDHYFVVSATYPNRVSFLATYHWFTFKKLGFWLNQIGAIPKYQFTTDLVSMKKIRYVVQENKGIIWIAPEGTVYANGKLGFIAPSIAKMAKFLKVPVYATKIEGPGLGNAKWSEKNHRTPVSVDTKLIVSQEEILSLPQEEILSRINNSLQYNEFDYQKRKNITVKGQDKALGFETMFYKCPVCGHEFTLASMENEIYCSNCHASAFIQDDFSFKWSTEKQYFKNYIQWYDWQYECIKKEVLSPDFEISDKVEFGCDKPGIDNYIKTGQGVLTLSHKGWDFRGIIEGKNVEDHDDLKSVPLATLKAGIHFELPFKDGRCRVFYPKNGLTSMKWHLASRAISELMQTGLLKLPE